MIYTVAVIYIIHSAGWYFMSVIVLFSSCPVFYLNRILLVRDVPIAASPIKTQME